MKKISQGLVLALCLTLAGLAHADDTPYNPCGKKEQHAGVAHARLDLKDALEVAGSAWGLELEKQANAIFGSLPSELVEAGKDYLTARIAYDLVDNSYQYVHGQRLALQFKQDPESVRQYDEFMKAEIALDPKEYDAEKARERAERKLDGLAAELATKTPLRAQYDRAFAWDDRQRELRLCAPPKWKSVMLDTRYCAVWEPGRAGIRYGLHRFGSYSNTEAVQSDQVLFLDLGATPPAKFIKDKNNRALLLETFLKDDVPECAQAH